MLQLPLLPEKDPPPAGGHRVAADPARRQGGQTRGGQIHRHAARRRQSPDGRRGLQPPDGRLQDRRETHAEDRASGRDDDGLPGHGRGGRLHQNARIGDPLRHGRPDAAAVERRRTARRVPGQAMTFRGLIGACVLLTARQQVVRRSSPGA